MHALEYILAKHSGRERVSAGEIITIEVDIAGVNDLYLQVIEAFWKMGGKRVWNPQKIVFFFDHYSPPSTIKAAENQRKMREFIAQQGIKHFFDVNEGVCHRVLFDSGLAAPGLTIIITDSHTTTHGAYGAFSTGVGATDMAGILLSGKLWTKVPEVIQVEITGTSQTGVLAKDILLHVLGKLHADGAVYKAVEFTGTAVIGMPLDERAVLTNMSVEMGAKASFIPVDEVARLEIERRRSQPFTTPTTDPDYAYSERFTFDVTGLHPQVALPGAVDKVVDVEEVIGTKIDQVYIGSCTGGSFNDLRVTATQLQGKSVPRGVRLIVSPASRMVYMQALKAGYIGEILRAGGTIINPGCGPCLGVHQGLLAPGEVCISSASRNFPGRMGSIEAQIYLASSSTAAASAVYGKIASPIARAMS